MTTARDEVRTKLNVLEESVNNGPLDALLPSPFVVPRYDGLSVANVPATLAAMLGAEVGTLPPLDERLWRHAVGDEIERVVLFVVDAIGWRRMQRALERDPATREWLDDVGATVAPLTAIFPSTTSATLTTLWTGVPPVQHGLLGFTLWLREVGAVGDMIRMRVRNDGLTGSLLDAGLDVHTFLPVPTVGQQLRGQGVEVHVLIGEEIRESGLSRLHFGGVESLTGYAGLGDCLEQVRQHLEASIGRRALIAAYWPSFDTLGHLRGPTPANWDAEWRVFMHAVRDVFTANLDRDLRRNTAIVVVADHGQQQIREERYVLFVEHPELAEHLLIPPTGDPRAIYLHARPGRREAIRGYVERSLFDAFHVLNADDALEVGLWGPGEATSETHVRIGDLVLLAKDDYALFPARRDLPLLGMHGSLTPDEALVPWIVWRLDG